MVKNKKILVEVEYLEASVVYLRLLKELLYQGIREWPGFEKALESYESEYGSEAPELSDLENILN